jgi:hypothetical protein
MGRSNHIGGVAMATPNGGWGGRVSPQTNLNLSNLINVYEHEMNFIF